MELEAKKVFIYNRLDPLLQAKVQNSTDPAEKVKLDGIEYSLYELRGLINENQREYGEPPMSFGPGFNNNYENYPPLKPTTESIREVEIDTDRSKGVFKKSSLLNPKAAESFGQDLKANNSEAKSEEDKRLENIARLQGFLADARVSPTEEIKPPIIALEIKNSDGSYSIWGTCGNFSAIIGKAKSRKSFLTNIALSAATRGGEVLGLIKSSIHHKPGVACFDTEQSKYHVQLAVRRVCDQTGIPEPENLHVFGLRKYTPAERLEIIEFFIYNNPDIGLIVIDGIKDLITSINDEEQATMIVSKLLKWTEEMDLHIITVLHQNKSDSNARGHIGTELVNKAETVLSVTKAEGDTEISLVEPEQCRNKEPEGFAFEVIDGLPVLASNVAMRTETKTSSVNATDIEDYELYKVLLEIYSHGDKFGYTILAEQFKLAFLKVLKKSVGGNKVIQLITYCKNRRWLLQELEGKPYTLGDYAPQNTDPDNIF
jgi:hypothetical protein